MNKDSPIRPYYIAYFDVLGYKSRLAEQQDDGVALFDQIRTSVDHVKNTINGWLASPALNRSSNGRDLGVKVFSDNFLIYMEAGDMESADELSNRNEHARLAIFLLTVATLQFDLLSKVGVFVRGALVKGLFAATDDFVFGRAIVDAVNIEENVAIYPRIVVDDSFLLEWTKLKATRQAFPEAVKLGDKIVQESKSGIESAETQLQMIGIIGLLSQGLFIENAWRNALVRDFDGKIFLNYLFHPKLSDCGDENFLKQFLPVVLEDADKKTFDDFVTHPVDYTKLLQSHRDRINESLSKYATYEEIDPRDEKVVSIREKVMRKYFWARDYHNAICAKISRPELSVCSLQKYNPQVHRMEETVITWDEQVRRR